MTRQILAHADVGVCTAGIAHLKGSLGAEAAREGAPVGVHCLSPGMVLTNLLLEGASDINKQVRLLHSFVRLPTSYRLQLLKNTADETHRLVKCKLHKPHCQEVHSLVPVAPAWA